MFYTSFCSLAKYHIFSVFICAPFPYRELTFISLRFISLKATKKHYTLYSKIEKPALHMYESESLRAAAVSRALARFSLFPHTASKWVRVVLRQGLLHTVSLIPDESGKSLTGFLILLKLDGWYPRGRGPPSQSTWKRKKSWWHSTSDSQILPTAPESSCNESSWQYLGSVIFIIIIGSIMAQVTKARPTVAAWVTQLQRLEHFISITGNWAVVWPRSRITNIIPSQGLVQITFCNLRQIHFTFSHHQQGRIDFNTVNPSLSTGKDFLIHSL